MVVKLGELLDMLTYMRPSDSDTEREFIRRYIEPLPGVMCDTSGNYHVIIGDDSPIVWSCHTDTVHKHSGRQTVHYDPLTGIVGLSKKAKRYADCLGADDTAGVWLCRQMVLKGIPGHYIFHHAEEAGGIGSNGLADDEPALLDGCLFAIALDRKGTSDVITRQMGECASDAFAWSLAGELNKGGLAYRPSDKGIFTDTANYTGIVGECTNLSVGYELAHSPRETLNVLFLGRLLDALCRIDVTQLVSQRKPQAWVPYSLSGWKIVDYPEHDSIADYAAPVRSRFAFENCEWCAQPYMLDASDAVDFCRFCDRDCERFAGAHAGEWGQLSPANTCAAFPPVRQPSTYLDPDYQDVIDALIVED